MKQLNVQKIKYNYLTESWDSSDDCGFHMEPESLPFSVNQVVQYNF